MKIVRSPAQIQKICLAFKRKGKSIAIVPTMGFLHEGHLSLIDAARRKADLVILTLFVNPLQFGKKEDLSTYPNDLKGDFKKCRDHKVDFVFCPVREDLYPVGYETYVECTQATKQLCGASRPEHFKGVTTIVAKLFNLIQPDYAFFGKKDFQQYVVICRMVKDLNLPIKVVGMPLVREKNGLAMSSRNSYLTPSLRKEALSLSRGLWKVRDLVAERRTDLPFLLKKLKEEIQKSPSARFDYVTCVDAETMQPLKHYKKGKTLFAVAVFFGKTRLIDNILI